MATTQNGEKMLPKSYRESVTNAIDGSGSYYNSVSTFKNIDIDNSVVSAYDVARNKSVAVPKESSLKEADIGSKQEGNTASALNKCDSAQNNGKAVNKKLPDAKFAHLRKPPVYRRRIPQPVSVAAGKIFNGGAKQDKQSSGQESKHAHLTEAGSSYQYHQSSSDCKHLTTSGKSILTKPKPFPRKQVVQKSVSVDNSKSLRSQENHIDRTVTKHLTLPSQEDGGANNKHNNRRKLPQLPPRRSSLSDACLAEGQKTDAERSKSVSGMVDLQHVDKLAPSSPCDLDQTTQAENPNMEASCDPNEASKIETVKINEGTCFVPQNLKSFSKMGDKGNSETQGYLKKMNSKLKTKFVSKLMDAELHKQTEAPILITSADRETESGDANQPIKQESPVSTDSTNENKKYQQDYNDNKDSLLEGSERLKNPENDNVCVGENTDYIDLQADCAHKEVSSVDYMYNTTEFQPCDITSPDYESVDEEADDNIFCFDKMVIQQLTDKVMSTGRDAGYDHLTCDSEHKECEQNIKTKSLTKTECVSTTEVPKKDGEEKLRSPEDKAAIEGASVSGKAADSSHKTEAENKIPSDKPATQQKARVERTPSYRRRVMARAKSRYKTSNKCKECSCIRQENGEIAVCQFCENFEKKMQRSHTSLGVTTNNAAADYSDSDSSDIPHPRRTMTPGLPPLPGYDSPKTLRRVQVSPRVELLMNSNLFRKHLKKHEDMLTKHTMSYKRFGMRKSVSNLDLSDTLNMDSDTSQCDNESVTSETTYDDDSENVDPLSLSLNLSQMKGSRRHSLTGESDSSVEYFHQAKKNSRPSSAKSRDSQGQQPHYPIPSFSEFRKRLDRNSEPQRDNSVTKSTDVKHKASEKVSKQTDITCNNLSDQKLNTIKETNSSENLLQLSEPPLESDICKPEESLSKRQGEFKKRLPDVSACSDQETTTSASSARTRSKNTERKPHRIRRKLKARSMSAQELDPDCHYHSTGDLSDTGSSSQSTPRRPSGKRPRSLISKKTSLDRLLQESKERPVSVSPPVTDGRARLKMEHNRSKSDSNFDTIKGRNSDTNSDISKGKNSECLTKGRSITGHTRHLSLQDKGGFQFANLDGDDSASQCSTQDVGESESSTSFANSTVSESIVSEVVTDDAGKLLNDLDDNEEAGKLPNETDDSDLDLSRNSKDDSVAPVLRSTSDACKITPEAARKRRERKERPYKSDPFSGTEIIPASKRYLLREERAKLKQQRSAGSAVSDDVLTFLDGVSHGQLARDDSFPSLEELNEDDEQLMTSTETISNRSWKLRKHVSNVSSLSTDSGVIGQEGSHDSQASSPSSTLLRHSQSECHERAWQQAMGTGTRAFSASCSDLTKQVVDCVDCSSSQEEVSLQQILQICPQCYQRRIERKKTIQEIMDTEINYGRDLTILKEEFYVPMMKAGLLNKDQLDSIFLNLDELIHVNKYFITKLKSSIHAANQHNDDDLQEVMIGNMFLESSTMFLTFENYCVNQAQAPILLESLEREKELLRIFLSVSQNDNHLLRRMHLKSFLMVPVQRIMRYPLLLDRLFKATPSRNSDKDSIREAKEKIEDILGHINAKSRTTSVKNRKSSEKHYSVTEKIEVSRVAIETLKWNRKDVCDVITSRLYMTQAMDHLWATKKCKNYKFTPVHAVLLTLVQPMSEEDLINRQHNTAMTTPSSSNNNNNNNNNNNVSIQSAALVLIKEKNGKYMVSREPFMLENCVVSQDPDYTDVFEILEWNKEAFLFKAESPADTRSWTASLRQQMHNLGCWRKRRNALPNILLNHLS